MSIFRNLCFFPLDDVKLPKCSAIVSIHFLFTYSSTCDTMFLSTYNDILHRLYLTVLFVMHLSYGLIRNTCDFVVFEYRSYHSSAEFMHIYKAFIRRRYSTFTLLSTRKFFLCSGFTLHMMSTNSPSLFNRIDLSFDMSALSYATGISEIPIYLPTCASIMRLMSNYSMEMVREDIIHT